MALGKRLTRLLEERNKRPIDLARMLKLPPSTVYSWIHGTGTPNSKNRLAICKALKITEAELFLDASMVKERGEPTYRALEEPAHLPLLETCPASPRRILHEEVTRWVGLPNEVVRGRRMYLLKVRGDGMNRAGIEDGDMVLVDADAEAKNGDIVVVRIDEEPTIRRFYRTEAKTTLLPDSTNPQHKPMVYDRQSEALLRGVVEVIYLKRLK